MSFVSGVLERGRRTVNMAVAVPVILAIGMLAVDAGVLLYEEISEAVSTNGKSLVPEKSVAELGRTPIKDLFPKLFINPIDQPLGVWVSAAVGGGLIGIAAPRNKK